MKLHTKIISLLLIAGLASAGAQSAGGSASNFYLKGSVGSADLESKGSLNELFSSFAGLNTKLDSAVAYTFEGGMYYGENFSFGFEWTMFNSDASDTHTLAAGTGEIVTIKGILGIAPGTELVGDFKVEEEIDSDRFMFVLNYEHYFNDQFSLLINTGLGVMNIEQTFKATSTPTAGAVVTPINSKKDDTVFAYQIGLTLGYHFNENLGLYGGARYLAASDIDFKHVVETDKTIDLKGFNPDALVYEVGMRYSF